jgi:nucleoside-diphosphate-sugar epimerase
MVGGAVTPHLRNRHELRILDLKPPADSEGVEYVEGSATDFDAVRGAIEGMDALLYMAMGSLQDWGSPTNVGWHFDVGPKGLYLALRAAHEAGVQRAVYTSSMSVFANARGFDPSVADYPPPDAVRWYGLTKRMGELAAEGAAADFGMSVVALRLYLPRPDEEWQTMTETNSDLAVAGSDLAAAIDAALVRGKPGFSAYPISGDYEGRVLNQEQVRRDLGWTPKARRS